MHEGFDTAAHAHPDDPGDRPAAPDGCLRTAGFSPEKDRDGAARRFPGVCPGTDQSWQPGRDRGCEHPGWRRFRAVAVVTVAVVAVAHIIVVTITNVAISIVIASVGAVI